MAGDGDREAEKAKERDAVAKAIQGTARRDCTNQDLADVTDPQRVRVAYGISDLEMETHSLPDAITNRIAAANL